MMRTDRKLLYTYRNGNYDVWLYSDGTKIKRTEADDFNAEFPDSVDLKITDKCDMNCPMCHESSSVLGAHGDLDAEFLNTFHFGTELAIGGGNPLTHPDLESFLERMRSRGVVCNLTLNEEHFLKESARVEKLLSEKLIYGLGISVTRCADETIEFARRHDSVVFHIVCGMTDKKNLSALYDKDLKVLLLGYKQIGRGAEFYDARIQAEIDKLKANITDFAKNFDTVSFDNLAIEQLALKDKLPERLFAERYMGDDGSASMYIDLVKGQYAVSSTSTVRYPVEASVRAMFEKVRSGE